MLMLGLVNLVLAAVAVAGLVTVCLVPRLFRTEAQTASATAQRDAAPERLAA
jgi:hypothetical protein